MKAAERNWICRILVVAAISFLGFHAVPTGVAGLDPETWQRQQEQKERQQQLLGIRFEKLLAQAKVQHAQMERWHRLHSGPRDGYAKNSIPKQEVHIATEFHQ